MPKFQAPRGTRDLLGAEMATFRRLEDKARELAALASLAAAENDDDIDRELLEKAKHTRVATA